MLILLGISISFSSSPKNLLSQVLNATSFRRYSTTGVPSGERGVMVVYLSRDIWCGSSTLRHMRNGCIAMHMVQNSRGCSQQVLLVRTMVLLHLRSQNVIDNVLNTWGPLNLFPKLAVFPASAATLVHFSHGSPSRDTQASSCSDIGSIFL